MGAVSAASGQRRPDMAWFMHYLGEVIRFGTSFIDTIDI